jgi:alanine dehydrogenase
VTDYVPMRLLDGEDVDALATVPVALEAAETAARLVAGGGLVTGRVQVNGPVAWMRVLAGMVTDLDLLGYKQFHRVGKRVRYHVHLFRESTGDPIGIVDGRRITSLRTASTAAAAVRRWVDGRRVRVGLIGSGEEAREGLRAIAGCVDVDHGVVFSPTPANREAFAAEMGEELSLEVRALGSQDEVTAACDVLYVATSSHHTPFLTADQVDGVGLVAAIGSTMPVHRELTGEVFARAGRVVIDTPDAVEESGDCIEGVESGWDPKGAVLLGDYLAREPEPVEGCTVFKSIGSVEQDLVLAYHLIGEAERASRGVVVDDVASLRLMR